MSHYPSAWKTYRGHVTSGVLPNDGHFNRFAARYRAASQLRGVSFAGISEATAAGYTEALRVALAYSALDALETATGSNSRQPAITVHTPVLAAAFRTRRCDKLRDFLQGNLGNKTLQERLAVLAGSDSATDVRPIVEGMRHLVFHGVFTPGGSGLGRSSWLRTFIADLAQEALDSIDQHFSAWLIPLANDEGQMQGACRW